MPLCARHFSAAIHVMPLTRVGALLAVLVCLAPTSASASRTGIFNETGCAGCHGAGSTNTELGENFPSWAYTSSSHTITLTVSNGSLSHAGFSVFVDGGTFSNPTGGSQVNGTSRSATHTLPSDSGSWTVRWTAPSTPGTVNFTFMGNAVNNNMESTGDTPAAAPITGTIDVYLPQGAVCNSGGECQTGRCVDSRCCNDACNGSCEACSTSAGSQSPDGICDALQAGYSAACCPGGGYWDGSICAEGCDSGIDNCDSDPDACQSQASAPFFSCGCPVGYEGTGVGASGCTDIPECDSDPCGVGACTELPVGTTAEGYSCACPVGYRAPPLGGTCVNIDECNDAPPESAPYDGYQACLPGACTEGAPGSFWTCSCPASHELFNRVSDGREICDLNECLQPSLSRCDANATCTNTIGSNTCACNEGYRDRDPAAVAGRVCDDIDECAEGLDACDPNADCMNLDGSYMCTCRSGWVGSGFTCADENECATGAGGCALHEDCVNNIGAPNDCVCAPGYTRETTDAACTIRCGDGTVGAGEQCDDANTAVEDGCSDGCEVELGWACYEPTGGASTCMNTCGDGLVDAAEDCDDGPENANDLADACRTDCRFPSCGDGTVDTGEACDDGDANDDALVDACRTTCDLPYCGDGVIDTGEACDVGGGRPGASAAGQCTTLCNADAGVDPSDPPVLTGGACAAAPRGASSAGGYGALLLAAIFLTRRRRRGLAPRGAERGFT